MSWPSSSLGLDVLSSVKNKIILIVSEGCHGCNNGLCPMKPLCCSFSSPYWSLDSLSHSCSIFPIGIYYHFFYSFPQSSKSCYEGLRYYYSFDLLTIVTQVNWINEQLNQLNHNKEKINEKHVLKGLYERRSLLLFTLYDWRDAEREKLLLKNSKFEKSALVSDWCAEV